MFCGARAGFIPAPTLTACRTVNGVIPPKRCGCYPPKGIRFYITNPIISTTCYRQRAIWQLNSYTFLLLHTFSTYFFDNPKVFCVKLRKIISKILSIIVKRLIFGGGKDMQHDFWQKWRNRICKELRYLLRDWHHSRMLLELGTLTLYILRFYHHRSCCDNGHVTMNEYF